MFLEFIIWTLFIASAVALVLWILIAPPADKKVRQGPENEDAYAKQRFIPSKVCYLVYQDIVFSNIDKCFLLFLCFALCIVHYPIVPILLCSISKLNVVE